MLEDRALPSITTFTIDPTASALSLHARADSLIGHVDMQEQAPGSLTTSYQGTVTADLDLNGRTITFLDDGNDAMAINSGGWRPHRPIPSDYGGQAQFSGITALMSVRNVVVAATSTPLDFGADGSFASNQTFTVASGDAAFKFTFFGRNGHGGFSMAGQTGNNGAPAGNLQVTDTQYLLTMPVDFVSVQVLSLGGFEITITTELYGTISAAAPLSSTAGGRAGLAVAAGVPAATTMGASHVVGTGLPGVVETPALITQTGTPTQQVDIGDPGGQTIVLATADRAAPSDLLALEMDAGTFVTI
jgi:hypothetical protein